jgi:hypothetical protein
MNEARLGTMSGNARRLAAGVIVIHLALFGPVRAQTPSCGTPPFFGQQFVLDHGPSFVASADLNGDGNPDVVTAEIGVSVLLGAGDGTFDAGPAYDVAGGARAIAANDLNSDGNADLAVVGNEGMPDQARAFVSILLGNGDGTFAVPVSYPVGFIAISIATDDLDGDGDADLAVADFGDLYGQGMGVSVLFGKGEGTFEAPVRYDAGNRPASIAVRDLDGDDHVDIAVANSGSGDVSVLLNDGDGAFGAPVGYPTGGTFSSWLAIDDLDGDGDADMAVSNNGSDNVAVLSGNGDGTFAAPVHYPIPYPGSLAIGDLDADGDGDLTVTGDLCVSTAIAHFIGVFLNSGEGTFGPFTASVAGMWPNGLAIDDFDGNDRTDVVVSNGGGYSKTVTILLGHGDGTFATAEICHSPHWPMDVAVDDLDGDGNADLAVPNDNTPWSVSVIPGHGDATFGPIVSYEVGPSPDSAAIDDLDGDGDADLVVTYDGWPGGLSVLLNDGDGTFAPWVNVAVLGAARDVAIGDLDGDADADLAVAIWDDQKAAILPGAGDGTFGPAFSYDTGGQAVAVAVGDLNGDDDPDIVIGNGSGGTVFVLLNNGDGTFTPGDTYDAGNGSVQNVALNDLDGDGDTDIAATVYVSIGGHVAVLLGSGDGTFAPAVFYGAGTGVHGLIAGDLDGDGRADLAVGNLISSNLSVLLGAGDGTFSVPLTFAAGGGLGEVAIVDLDGDGGNDLAGSFAQGISLFRNNTCRAGDIDGDGSVGIGDFLMLLAAWGSCPGPGPPCPADLDGDGTVGIGDFLILLANWD